MSTTPPLATLRILFVDDDKDIRRTLGNHLSGQGYEVEMAEDAERAVAIMGSQAFDIVITDVRMPGMDGFELLRRVRAESPESEVIVVTAFGDVDSAVRALREGAFDYFTKPINVHDIAASLQRTARFHALRQENERYRERLERLDTIGRARYGLDAIVGTSEGIQQVRELIAQVGDAEVTTVLITGETGTGKELVARAIHYESSRTTGPFVAVDCSSVPRELIESAFYGHVQGAFTDARESHKGYFEQADGGTLFLDEIGDMDRSMQVRLLRTLEERVVRRVGSESETPVDVRVISATNRDLAEAISAGEFRSDLYYRLNTFTIHVPPLRQRIDDIEPLALYFLEEFSAEMRKEIDTVSPDAVQRLQDYSFPGNVRELRNTIERAVICCQRDTVEVVDLDASIGVSSVARGQERASGDGESAEDDLNLAEIEERLIRTALERAEGQRALAARLLGISRDALRRRMGRYGID